MAPERSGRLVDDARNRFYGLFYDYKGVYPAMNTLEGLSPSLWPSPEHIQGGTRHMASIMVRFVWIFAAVSSFVPPRRIFVAT